MFALPLNIDMHKRLTVIVGGGKVALRKVHALLAVGAECLLIAPEVCPEISELAAEGFISVRLERYTATGLDNAFLVVAATDDALVNQTVAADAAGRGLLVSVVDNPASGNCAFPAVLRRGALEIAVSTGGRCPTLATEIRDLIADLIGEEYGLVLEQLAVEREKLLTDGSPSTYNNQVLRSLAGQLIAELTERKDTV